MYALILKKTNGYLPIPTTEPVEFIVTDKLWVKRADGILHEIDPSQMRRWCEDHHYSLDPAAFLEEEIIPQIGKSRVYFSTGVIKDSLGLYSKDKTKQAQPPTGPSPKLATTPAPAAPSLRVMYNDPDDPAYGCLGTLVPVNFRVEWDDGSTLDNYNEGHFGHIVVPAPQSPREEPSPASEVSEPQRPAVNMRVRYSGFPGEGAIVHVTEKWFRVLWDGPAWIEAVYSSSHFGKVILPIPEAG